MENTNYNHNEENRKKKKWWLLLLLLLLLLGIGLGIGYKIGLDSCEQNPPIQTPTETPTVPDRDPNQGEFIEPEPVAPAKGVAVPGWASITIPKNQKDDIVVDFYNPEENKDMYYLTFELRIPNNSVQGYEVLYKSGLIEPGLHIQKISLSRPIEAGTYNAIIHVQPYRIADKSLTNNADLKTELIVK